MGSLADQIREEGKKIISVPWGKVMIIVIYVIHILVLVTNISRIVVGYFANVQDSIVECRLQNFSVYLIASGAIFLFITVINAGFRVSYLHKKMKKIWFKSLCYAKCPKAAEILIKCWSALAGAAHLSLCIWGIIVVYGNYMEYTDARSMGTELTETQNSNFCQPTAYWFAFAALTSDYIGLVFLFILICCYQDPFIHLMF